MAEGDLKILVADETAARMQLLRDALAECGFTEVICVSGCDDLLDTVYASNPDLILIDVESPRRDTLEQLSQIQQWRPKPVVLFTQDQQLQTIEAAIRSGVTAYVTSGISVSEVRPALDVAMATFRNFQRLREELLAVQTDLSDTKLVQRAKALLIEQQKLTEDKAYHLIRRVAMNRKIKLAEVAREIISAGTSRMI
jgi:response regulator NasT